MKLRWILALTAVITAGLTQAHEDSDDPDHTHDEGKNSSFFPSFGRFSQDLKCT